MPTLAHPILVPAIRLDRDDGTEEATALRRAREPWVAGFCLFGGEAEHVARLTARLREEAGRPLFVASDMERGAGQQVKGLSELPDAGIVGLAGSPEDARAFGEITAREARSVGIDVIFAPVVDVRSELDNPIVGNRSYGWSPERVGSLAAAFCRGARAGGALPVAKHYPGHGATVDDSHDAVPVVREAANVLLQRDIEPFFTVLRDGQCPAFMTAHVSYPALDPLGVIATFSRAILHPDETTWGAGLGQLPVLFTDALLMAGARRAIGEVQAARRSLAAGCDALLYPEGPERIAAELLSLDDDLIAEVERAARRLAAFAEEAEAPAAAASPGDLREVPPSVARRAVRLATGGELADAAEVLWILDDDDVNGRAEVLHARAREAGARCEVVRIPRGEQPRLEAGDADRGCVVILAGVGAWKGASGIRPETQLAVDRLRKGLDVQRREARVVWCAPRAAEGDLHVPGTGRHVEAALADALFGPEAVGSGA